MNATGLYRIGKIVTIGKTYIILESQYVGYIVYVANPTSWEAKLNKVYRVYLYQHKSEYHEALYGFHTFSERILFDDLTSLPGIGPKTAMSVMKHGENMISNWIANGAADELAKIPHIGAKTANQIVLELQAKYEKHVAKNADGNVNYPTNDLTNSLRALGFNTKQIDYALEQIKLSSSLEKMIEAAIKVIANVKFT